jgi:hypothetical protein
MAEGERHEDQQDLDFEGRREWLGKPAVRKLLVSLACRKLGQTCEAAEDLVQDFYALKLDPVARAYDPTRFDPALVVTAFLRFGCSKLGKKPGPQVLSTDDPDVALRFPKAFRASATTIGHSPGDPELLRRALTRLPNSTRSLIDAFYVGELSHAELAQREGKTVAAIKVALHRARHLLRREYVEEAVALTVSDFPDFPTFLEALASHASMPDIPVGFIFSLLPTNVQALLTNGSSHSSSTGTDGLAVVRALNDVVRSNRLDACPCLRPIATSLEDVADPSEIRSFSIRNRQILEVVFEPLIRKFEYASVL